MTMDDLGKYIEKRKARDPEFAAGFDAGYREFVIGVMLKEAREKAGVTQEELADAISTKKSVISRLENQSNDARVSTLRKVADALGKDLVIELRDRKRVRAKRKGAVVA
jgi:ribosome-binding protein aMBF1 (putative translation factor)